MNTKALFVIGAASLLIAGCPQLQRPDEAKKPGGDPTAPIAAAKCELSHPVCHITVRVTNCTVVVDPKDKHVASRPSGVQMIWTIRESRGVTFAHNGIMFKRPFEDARGLVFTAERRALVSPTFVMHNSTTPGTFPYTVNVVDNGKRCDPHDPSVVNEM